VPTPPVRRTDSELGQIDLRKKDFALAKQHGSYGETEFIDQARL
jgi:hypothetical protein